MPENTEQPKDQPVKLTFSFPDVITIAHYQVYAAARLKFIDDHRGGSVPNNLAAYEGARALVNAGIVHIKSDEVIIGQEGYPTAPTMAEKIKAMIGNPDQSGTPVGIMNLVGGVIAAKVEAESINPTLFGKSYNITTTP